MSASPSNEPTEDTLAPAKPPFLRRVRIRGYKSIAFCDVTLEPLTILVGRNASGKSNFLNALSFLRDVVSVGAHEAVKRHGGRESVLCQLTDSSLISLEIEAGVQMWKEPSPFIASFAIVIAMPAEGPPDIVSECATWEDGKSTQKIGYRVEDGYVSWEGHPFDNAPDAFKNWANIWPNPDRVFLGTIGPTESLKFRECIASIETYNFHPGEIRRPQEPNPGGYLDRDGKNLASVIETTRKIDAWAIERPSRYLTDITKTTEFAEVLPSGGYETLQFRVRLNDEGSGRSIQLPAASMSDGTLRAFAALVAAFQCAPPYGPPNLVAIEEPETSLHPAAMRALVDALDEATLRTQILLTTHSADMLDNPTIRPEQVRVVQMVNGRTVIGTVDDASIQIVARKLGTLGGLERENQLEPDQDDLERQQHLSSTWKVSQG
ncbi:AAA family ATPase [Fimbriiglobus ruber]|nr:AAA family ATPase [Fimbriiglobus ruber]